MSRCICCNAIFEGSTVKHICDECNKDAEEYAKKAYRKTFVIKNEWIERMLNHGEPNTSRNKS